LVGSGKSRILIDTGEGKEAYESLLHSSLQSAGCERISMILITHHHKDHIGGIDQVKKLMGDPFLPVYQHHLFAKDAKEITDGQIFETQGARLRALYSPGHTQDHMAFYLEEENAIFTGDCVLGHGTAVFEDLAAILQSLDSFLKFPLKRLYPGHGAVIENGAEKIQEYIRHRKEREEMILTLLKEKAATSLELVQKIYPEIPPDVIKAANQVVCLHLAKLQGEGRVSCENDSFSIA
jgi:glyoxylase-like metal-dependent hydrolase (beta-lactamase superfamily II)